MKSFILIICFISTGYYAAISNRPSFDIELLYSSQLETDGQIVISPFGIWSLMAGLALGADGDSYNQISQAFKLPSDRDALTKAYKRLANTIREAAKRRVTIINQNFMFLDRDLNVNAEFKNGLQENFKAIMKELDFEDPNSVEIANTFIRNTGVTNSGLLSSDDFTSARMILINFIRFRGLWTVPFDISNTREEPFYDENQQAIGSVNMMHGSGKFATASLVNLKASVIELLYGVAERFYMLVVLPDPNIKIGDILREMSLEDIFEELRSNLREFELKKVDVMLPRFKIKTKIELKKLLEDMNVVDIFQTNVANLHNIAEENIFVSAIHHVADIEVIESSTVDTAESDTISGSRRKRTPLESFTANRPFLYFIVHKPTVTMIVGGVHSKPTLF